MCTFELHDIQGDLFVESYSVLRKVQNHEKCPRSNITIFAIYINFTIVLRGTNFKCNTMTRY